jgi:hypothetical protein
VIKVHRGEGGAVSAPMTAQDEVEGRFGGVFVCVEMSLSQGDAVCLRGRTGLCDVRR